MDVLIDTSILVDLLRNHPPALQWRAENQQLDSGITPIIWLEVIRGGRDKSRQRRAAEFLSQFDMVYLTAADQDWAMRQLQRYHLSHNVGMIDCLIAAPGYRLGLPLHSHNLKHFTPLLGALVQRSYQVKEAGSCVVTSAAWH